MLRMEAALTPQAMNPPFAVSRIAFFVFSFITCMSVNSGLLSTHKDMLFRPDIKYLKMMVLKHTHTLLCSCRAVTSQFDRGLPQCRRREDQPHVPAICGDARAAPVQQSRALAPDVGLVLGQRRLGLDAVLFRLRGRRRIARSGGEEVPRRRRQHRRSEQAQGSLQEGSP